MYDATFALDDFMRPRLCDTSEIVKNILLFILFAKPGQYPSLPHIGLDIESRLFSFYDEINETELRDQIVEQCNELAPYFDNGSIVLRKLKYRKQPSLLIQVATSPYDNHGKLYLNSAANLNETTYQIGITYDELNRMVYNITDGGI